MAGNGGRQIGQNVEALEVAGFSDGQQTRGGEFAIGATVAETDLAPLHAGAEGAFHAVVGGLYSISGFGAFAGCTAQTASCIFSIRSGLIAC